MALRRAFTRVLSHTGVPIMPKDPHGLPVDVSQPHQSSKLSHLSDAEERLFKVPPIVVDDDVVRCGGVRSTGLGHPIVYIQLNTRDPTKPAMCKWCGLRYVRNPELNH